VRERVDVIKVGCSDRTQYHAAQNAHRKLKPWLETAAASRATAHTAVLHGSILPSACWFNGSGRHPLERARQAKGRRRTGAKRRGGSAQAALLGATPTSSSLRTLVYSGFFGRRLIQRCAYACSWGTRMIPIRGCPESGPRFQEF
jgi:hypothetical protein